MFLTSTTELIELRGLRYHVRHWGTLDAPKLFLLHGWMDSSATFQFVVDAFQNAWHIIAPDWRGYGDSEWLGGPYWFPDYYADLDALLQHYSPDEPAQLVGHSMGANIAATFAGLRPQRVARLAMLDFLGLKPDPAIDAPAQIGKWLDEIAEQPRLRVYPDHGALARRLRFANPRLTVEQAEFLSRAVSRVTADGSVEMACDPWHKVASPALYRVEDAMAAWRRVTAPVLMVIAEKGFVNTRFGQEPDEFQRRIGSFSNVQIHTVADAGHNVHHDQPEIVAGLLEGFLQR
ncbi:MAG: alpha/beta hydrolase [Betaproteobacteria bacterium HGW-Betaproteobacteria-5]|jgi:pimeloyl-ACP methyl ester carboxylesterase|nr:MAG: alpha/beta hydrolase [Betaproteobacteria bacterium HGW-Betaproteobacteria-5]PKO38632.1 MAG: alpha/beta hydrolase [Betaproteobacteria bacterium HGW-Betaproteobacteria-6]